MQKFPNIADMKRLVRRRSGRLSFGPKWQDNVEGTNESDNDNSLHSAAVESGDDHHSVFVESTETVQVSDTEAGNTIPIPTSRFAAAPPTLIEADVVLELPITGDRARGRSDRVLMYKAALEGDWLAAENLLKRDRTLACDEITERGDRALHVAAAMKHKQFVQELVEWMSPTDLVLLDGRGYTACCYAAVTGIVRIAEVMMGKNPKLGSARDKNNMTPLHKAALRGRERMVWYFLESIKFEDLSKEEWFDLLLVTIRRKMYGAALEILEKDGSLATMRNDEGTALHLLAGVDISSDFVNSKLQGGWALESIFRGRHALIYFRGWRIKWWRIKFAGEMQSDLRLLAEKLWAEIQTLEEASVLELMKHPPILHDAAKVGNVELITMLSQTYPDLIWDTDKDGYTIFHIAVIHRHENVFNLIRQIGAMKDFIAISQDKNGNNILHLAGELAPPNARKIVPLSALQMTREISWFKQLQAIVPPLCREMRNNDGLTPGEFFSKQHNSLLEKSEIWMRNTADSCMLISTIMLTVVFSAAFTPPGGFDEKTGLPLLWESQWFTCFLIFEALALFGSTWSIMHFWTIMTSSFREERFMFALPKRLRMGLIGLLISLVGAISAFMSAYFLVFVQKRVAPVKSVTISVFVILVYVILLVYLIFRRYHKLMFDVALPALSWKLSSPGRHTLFRGPDTD